MENYLVKNKKRRNINFCVVIVTFNRLEKLKIALGEFDKQTYLPKDLVVVNNCSTDGTDEFLKVWECKAHNYKKHVITLKKNVGGSGGFYTGLKYALNLDDNWIWVSDDDAFPEVDALENANNFLSTHDNKRISAICGAVINKGKIDLAHRKNCVLHNLKVTFPVIPIEEYEKEWFKINCFSYVGTIINKKKLVKAGLPEYKYFIWLDDTEHSLRLNNYGKILCVPKIRVHHDVQDIEGFSWKLYYGIRNEYDMDINHFPKIYAHSLCLRKLLHAFLDYISGKNKLLLPMTKKAIKDARNQNFGMDTVYKPGVKINK